MNIFNIRTKNIQNAFDRKTKPLIDAMGEFEPDMNTPLIPVLAGTSGESETLYIRRMKLKEPSCGQSE